MGARRVWTRASDAEAVPYSDTLRAERAGSDLHRVPNQRAALDDAIKHVFNMTHETVDVQRKS